MSKGSSSNRIKQKLAQRSKNISQKKIISNAGIPLPNPIPQLGLIHIH